MPEQIWAIANNPFHDKQSIVSLHHTFLYNQFNAVELHSDFSVMMETTQHELECTDVLYSVQDCKMFEVIIVKRSRILVIEYIIPTFNE